jgi:hypothetical protein
MDNKYIHTVCNLNSISYYILIPLERVPESYLKKLQIGESIALYAYRVLRNKANLTIMANPHDKRIPELLIKSAMRESGYPIGNIKCKKRILGYFSILVTDKPIDKEVIKKVSRILKERITIEFLRAST